MIDFMWEHVSELLPGFAWDWKGFGYPVDPLEVDRIALWTFRGDPRLGVGLTAILASVLGWLNTSKTTFVLNQSMLQTLQSDPTQRTPAITDVDPSSLMPIVAEGIAKVWGELEAQRLLVHFQAADGTRTDWTLEGNLAAIVQQLLDLSLEIQKKLGIETPRRPDEPLDLPDTDLLTGFVSAWGEVLIAAQFLSLYEDNATQQVTQAIAQLQKATLVGSRFACWGACHTLSTVIAHCIPEDEGHAQVIQQCQDLLLNLGTLFSKVAWPSIMLGILALEDDAIDQAIDLFESAVESDPLVLITWRLLIQLYELNENYDEAVAACKEAIAGELADGALYFQLGKLYVDKPFVDEETTTVDLMAARDAFVQAEQAGFRTPEMFNYMVDVGGLAGDSDFMWAAFRALVETDLAGTWLIEIVERVEAYGDFEPGLAILREVRSAHPDRFAPALAHVLALIGLERNAEAAQEIPALRQLASTDGERVEMAALALEAEDPDFAESFETLDEELSAGMVADAGAISYLQEVVAREPLFADAALALATAYESRQEIEPALAVLAKTRQLLPDYHELILSEADILWGADRDTEALALLESELKKPRPNAEVLARISEYYLLSDDPTKMMIYLNTALILDPFNEEVERVFQQFIEQAIGGFVPEFDADDYDDEEDIGN